MKKKLLSSLLACGAILTLVACGGPSRANPPVTTSTPESQNTFSSDITSDQQAILASITSGDFVKNGSFQASNGLQQRFDVTVSGTLSVIVYYGSQANSFGNTCEMYVGVSVTDFTIVGVQLAGSYTNDHSASVSESDVTSFEEAFVGTDGNIDGNLSGASQGSGVTYKTLAQAAVAQAKLDAGGSSSNNTFSDDITAEEQEYLAAITSGNFAKDTDFTATNGLQTKYDVTVDDTLSVIVYYGSQANSFGNTCEMYVGVSVTDFTIVGVELAGSYTNDHSVSISESDVTSFEEAFVGTDGNIEATLSGATMGSTPTYKTLAQAAVAQAKLDAGSSTSGNSFSDDITAEEQEYLAAITSGNFTKDTTFTATNGLQTKYDVTVDDTLSVIVYYASQANSYKHTCEMYVGVSVTDFTIVGVQLAGTYTNDTRVEISESDVTSFEEAFVGTDGNIEATISGATKGSTPTYKTLAQAAVAQAKLDA